MEKSTQTKNISRRNFLALSGGATFFITASMMIPSLNSDEKEESKSSKLIEREVNVWVHIREDGRIMIYNPAAEMGQGSMTALPVIIAEELDVAWENVHIEHSPIEPAIYGAGWGGRGRKSMITVGSRTVASYYESMRQAGAQARYVLLANVAEKWDVPISELSTESGVVLHQKTDKRISYGEIATFAKEIKDIPEISKNQLKDPSDFRLIGTVVPRFDIPAKVDGSAQYSMDVQLEGMVYGVINRSPVNGSKPTLENESEIKAINGILDIVKLDHGIGLIAESIELALKTKSKLEISWSKGAKAESHSSEDAYAEYDRMASGNTKGNFLTDEGNVETSLNSGEKTYSIDYKNDHLYHAQMEPLNAVVSVAQDGQSAEAWVGTQAQPSARSAVARTLGIDVSKVKLNAMYLGGGLGRRSASDYVEEATILANAIKRPLKLIWTREDDLQYGMYRPMSLQRMKASVDRSGNILAWHHIIIGTGDRLIASGARTGFYTFPNQRVELRSIDHGIRTKHWRAVGHGPNKFAIEAFIDEVAVGQKIDPYELRLRLMKDSPRAQNVLKAAAKMANWGSVVPEGRGSGIAFAERSGSLSACVCEVSLDKEKGKIKVHHIWSAIDAGVVVQPDNVIAQMEGGMIMGLSSIFVESLTIKEGKVQESNFHDYPILRISDVPDSIDIKLISSTERPTGVGESAIPVLGGAVANAFGALTGKRLRHLPFTPEKVKEVLKG